MQSGLVAGYDGDSSSSSASSADINPVKSPKALAQQALLKSPENSKDGNVPEQDTPSISVNTESKQASSHASSLANDSFDSTSNHNDGHARNGVTLHDKVVTAKAAQPRHRTKRRRRAMLVGFETPNDLPDEILDDLVKNGATEISFIEVDARASASVTVNEADKAATLGGAVHRAHTIGQSVTRAQKRTHHITSLAASAVASIAARDAAEQGHKRSRSGK
jgi:RNase P protein component